MPATKGRNIIFRWGGGTVAGVREKSLSLNGEAVDVTSDEDAGWRALLADVSQEDQVEIGLSGVMKSQGLVEDWFNGTRTRNAQFEYPDGSIISGTFFLQSLTVTGPYNDAATFEATLVSSGAVTYTPYS